VSEEVRMKCCAEACNRSATHRVLWRSADVSIALCPEHLNVWLNDTLEVSTDLESEWRQPPKAQVVLDEIVDQGVSALESGDLVAARRCAGMAASHVTNTRTQDVVLNTARFDAFVEDVNAAGLR
jgi:hypothetical protein